MGNRCDADHAVLTLMPPWPLLSPHEPEHASHPASLRRLSPGVHLRLLRSTVPSPSRHLTRQQALLCDRAASSTGRRRRRPDHSLRTAYRGTPAYPPPLRWVLAGRYVPFDVPRATTVAAAVEGLEYIYDATGRIDFEVDGLPLSLTAFAGAMPGGLTVLFTDTTAGVTTYPAVRSLAVDPPGGRGEVALDFNRAGRCCAIRPAPSPWSPRPALRRSASPRRSPRCRWSHRSSRSA